MSHDQKQFQHLPYLYIEVYLQESSRCTILAEIKQMYNFKVGWWTVGIG